ncbi:chitobiase/beta-hexosaminidase C-terminal domain-containing protein [Bacillus chungangensis]|uniref:GH29D-like beta-sandwich domain-containing protein n=1 Tax=Bacillus chungangensis TaxID=587633 RepID=A0ABT9WTU7_9BACI|nr:chitobiase/beta-hexosaminidase C-terminal domain-containing protein [Bacillus chungangensis]MDQ0176726.1 hypothetical protein [Bacillus chungangensis]
MAYQMLTGITKDTPKNLAIGPGMVMIDFSSPDPGKWGTSLGATKGGNKFNLETEWHVAEPDGLLGPVLGMRWLTKMVPSIEVNLMEMTKESFMAALPGSVFKTCPDGKYEVVGHEGEVFPSQFRNVALIGNITGKKEPVIIGIRNAMAVDPVEINMGTGKEDVVLKVKFVGHFAPENPYDVPYCIYYPLEELAGFEGAPDPCGCTKQDEIGDLDDYRLDGAIIAPEADPPEGNYHGTQSIKLITTEPNSKIYYVLNDKPGEAGPTLTSSVYTKPISLSESKVISTVIVTNDNRRSPVYEFNYIIGKE